MDDKKNYTDTSEGRTLYAGIVEESQTDRENPTCADGELGTHGKSRPPIGLIYAISADPSSGIYDYFTNPAEFLSACEKTPGTLVICIDMMRVMYPVLQIAKIIYDVDILARSITSAYTVDLHDRETGERVVRFFDPANLCGAGQDAMAALACCKGNALQVAQAYIDFLCTRGVPREDIGMSIVSQAGIFRAHVKQTIGRLTFENSHKNKITLARAWKLTCIQQQPANYFSYAMQKACTAGGLAFTSAQHACDWQGETVAIDANSIYHAFILGSYMPLDFKKYKPRYLQAAAQAVINTPRERVLKNYCKPFNYAINAAFTFENVRLKEGTPFFAEKIGLVAYDTFSKKTIYSNFYGNEAQQNATEAVKERYHNTARGARFAFSKLMSADACTLFLTEIELWLFAQVYDFDRMSAVEGEATIRFRRVPEYLSMQSVLMYGYKQKVKNKLKSIDERDPEFSTLKNIYMYLVKGIYNSVYGSQAVDMCLPRFTTSELGVMIDPETLATPENYDEIKTERPRNVYSFGMRIPARGRMHLVIAMFLIYEQTNARIIGGQTDSLYIAGVTYADIARALIPLHDATERAIEFCQRKPRALYGFDTDLSPMGKFEFDEMLKNYVQYNNMNHAAITGDGLIKISCAGLARNEHDDRLARFVDYFTARGYAQEFIIDCLLGVNATIDVSLSDNYTIKLPTEPGDTWQRVPCQFSSMQLKARQNAKTYRYLLSIGRDIDITYKVCGIKDGKPFIKTYGREGIKWIT